MKNKLSRLLVCGLICSGLIFSGSVRAESNTALCGIFGGAVSILILGLIVESVFLAKANKRAKVMGNTANDPLNSNSILGSQNDNNNQQDAKLEQLQQQNLSLTQTVTDLRGQLQQYKEQNNADEQTKKIKQQETEIEELKRQVSQLNASLLEKHKNDQWEKEKENLTAQITDLNKQINNLKQKFQIEHEDQPQENPDKQTGQLEMLCKKKNELTSKFSRAPEKIREQAQKFADGQEVNARLKKENNDLLKKIEELEAKLHSSEQNSSKEINELKKHNNSLAAKIKESNEKFTMLTQTCNKSNAQKKESEKLYMMLQNENNQLIEKNNQLSQMCTDLEYKITN